MKYVYNYIGNWIWKLFGGVWLSLFWFGLAIIFGLTIVGVPVAVKCFWIGMVAWKPSARKVAINITSHYMLNILWCMLVVWVLLPFALVSILLQIATLFGIPLTMQWYKVIKLNLFPFGAIIK